MPVRHSVFDHHHPLLLLLLHWKILQLHPPLFAPTVLYKTWHVQNNRSITPKVLLFPHTLLITTFLFLQSKLTFIIHIPWDPHSNVNHILPYFASFIDIVLDKDFHLTSTGIKWVIDFYLYTLVGYTGAYYKCSCYFLVRIKHWLYCFILHLVNLCRHVNINVHLTLFVHSFFLFFQFFSIFFSKNYFNIVFHRA